MEIQDAMPRPGRMFLSIVVPCFNEEESLREFHRQTTAAARALCGQKFELILVDDGSTDNTWKLINELSAKTATSSRFASPAITDTSWR
jgi:dolichol-phosphate mannosyltransferase